MNLLITYRDIDNAVTEREISDMSLSPYGGAVDAFCHLKQARRTFGLRRIKSAVDVLTGEVITDFAAILKVPPGRYVVADDGFIAAVKALKYFCLQVRRKRGFAEKERRKILDFIDRNDQMGVAGSSPDAWLCGLWAGDIFDSEDSTYQDNLDLVPKELLGECRFAAIHIAAGSGRVVALDDIMERINSEFPADGSSGKQKPGHIIPRAERGPGVVFSLGPNGVITTKWL